MDYIRFGVLIAVIAISSAAPQAGDDDLNPDYDDETDGVECMTKSPSYNGLCVKYYECQPNAPLMVLFNEGAKCSSYLDVCCPRTSLTSDWKFNSKSSLDDITFG